MPVTLPNELTDRIIAYLHKSPDDLRACSLACKAFLPAARHHLYYSTSILLRGVPHLPAPHVAPHIRELAIEERRSSVLANTLPPTEILARVAAHPGMENVHTLHLAWFTFLANPSMRFANVRKLRVAYSSFPNFETLVAYIVRVPPNLEELELRSVAWRNTDGAFLDAAPNLHSVVWSNVSCVRELVEWLFPRSGSSFDALHTLGNLGVRQEDTHAMMELLDRVGGNLQHLHLGYPSAYSSISDSAPLIPLIPCTSLDTLTITLAFHTITQSPAIWLLLPLEHLPSLYLHTLTFRITYHTPLQLFALIPLEDIDILLDKREALKKVVFELWDFVRGDGGDDGVHVKREVERRMKRVAGKGIVCFA